MSGALQIHLVERASDIAAADWDLAFGHRYPFARHAFFTALEDSGSATAATGWQPLHLLAKRPDGQVAGLLPGYLKSHSQGEYVFDHGWADAWERAGHAYYPKLQHAAPFTPATAPRLLTTDAEARALLVAASASVVRTNGFSGSHATFLTDVDASAFTAAGWLERHDVQFHWFNKGYKGFDDFLHSLSSRKRKTLRRERAAALAGVDRIVRLTGADLSETAWDAFWAFYQDTGSRKWGRPYLTRDFFRLIGERMGEQVMLVLAEKDGRYVAGALNFLGDDCIYGRQWGAIAHIPFLHFELCYHQAIDIACERGLARVEAGAQGAHKIARGYQPVETRSCHFIADPQFRDAVADFLQRERRAVHAQAEYLSADLPFRHQD